MPHTYLGPRYRKALHAPAPRSPCLHLPICPSAHLVICPFAAAQPDPSGIDFVTLSDPGNPNWTGGGTNNNRGGVDYEFKIGRFDVTTAQWVEFMNAGFDRPAGDAIPFLGSPRAWTAERITPQNGGTRRWASPAGGK